MSAEPDNTMPPELIVRMRLLGCSPASVRYYCKRRADGTSASARAWTQWVEWMEALDEASRTRVIDEYNELYGKD